MDRGRRREVREKGTEKRGGGASRKVRKRGASNSASSRSPREKRASRASGSGAKEVRKRKPRRQELAPRTLPRENEGEEDETPPAVKKAREEKERLNKSIKTVVEGLPENFKGKVLREFSESQEAEKERSQPSEKPRQKAPVTLAAIFPKILEDAETGVPGQWYVRCPSGGKCTGRTKRWFCTIKNSGNASVEEILKQKEVNEAVRKMMGHCWSLQDDGKHPPEKLLESWTVELDSLKVEREDEKQKSPKRAARKSPPLWEGDASNSDEEGSFSRDSPQEQGEEEEMEIDDEQNVKVSEAEGSGKRNRSSSEPAGSERAKGEAKKGAEAFDGDQEGDKKKNKEKIPVPEPVAAPKPKVGSAVPKARGLFEFPVVAKPPEGDAPESSSSEGEKKEEKMVAALGPPAPKQAPRELARNREDYPKAGMPLVDASSWSAAHFQPVFPSSSSSAWKPGCIGTVLHDPFRDIASKTCGYCGQTAVRACANNSCQSWICADHSSRGSVGSHCGWRVCTNCHIEDDTSEEVSEILSSSSRARALITLDDFGVFAGIESPEKEHVDQESAPGTPEEALPSASAEESAVKDEEKKEELKDSDGTLESEQLIRKRKGGPVLSSFRGAKERGSSSAALKIARSGDLFDVAVKNFEALTYAAGVKESKSSKFSLWAQLCEARGFSALPLTAEKIKEVGAVLRAARFRSGYSYLCEAFQEHVRKGWPKTELLQVSLKDAERALSRGLGGPEKAAEIRLTWWDQVWQSGGSAPLLVHQSEETRVHPAGGVFLWGFGTAFALREVELGCLCLDSVVVDREQQVATLDLPASKKDPAARGCKRSRGCECGVKGDVVGESPPSCPYHAALYLQDLQVRRSGVNPTELGASEVPFVGQNGEPDKFCSKKAVIDRLREDAITVKTMVIAASDLSPNEVAGHSLRRSGIKDLARRGVSRQTCQWFARHSSDAVDGYIEEAAEECPLGDRKVVNEISFLERLGEVRQKCDESATVISNMKEDLACLKGNEAQLREEIEFSLRPEAVRNRATNKIHSTRPGSFIGPSLEWTTACGWEWIRAGRLAEPFRVRDRTSKHAVCKTCTEFLKL